MKKDDSSSSPTLKWVKVNGYFAETECRRYRCRKFLNGKDVMSDPGKVRYQIYGPNGQRVGAPQANSRDAAMIAARDAVNAPLCCGGVDTPTGYKHTMDCQTHA